MPIFSFSPSRSYLENLTIDDKFINKPVRLFIHNTKCLKCVEKKKLLGRRNKDISLKTFVKWLLITFKKMQEHPPEVFYKKAVVENLAIFTEKNLYWSLYLIQNITKFFGSTCFEENLRIAAAENV